MKGIRSFWKRKGFTSRSSQRSSDKKESEIAIVARINKISLSDAADALQIMKKSKEVQHER